MKRRRNPDIIYGDFIFDENKNRENIKNHQGISLYEAASSFDDPFILFFDDPDHSIEENRFLAYGESDEGRLLVVSYTPRGRLTRLISARKAEPKERRKYAKARR